MFVHQVDQRAGEKLVMLKITTTKRFEQEVAERVSFIVNRWYGIEEFLKRYAYNGEVNILAPNRRLPRGTQVDTMGMKTPIQRLSVRAINTRVARTPSAYESN